MDPWVALHVLGMVAGLIAWAMAWLVYVTRPRASANRRLAILLAVEGTVAFVLGGSNFVDVVFAFDAGPIQSVINFLLLLLAGTYFAFLATLDSPFARPLRSRVGTVVIAITIVGPNVAWFVAGGYTWANSTHWGLLMLWLAAAATMGLVVSLTALGRASSPEAKFRARSYALAFGAHDFIWGVGGLVVGGFVVFNDFTMNLMNWGTPQISTIILVPLLGYGILRYQVLDIDLRLKFVLQKSTIVAAFATTFLVASELFERFLNIDGTLIGLTAAIGIGLVFRRVEAGANALADRMMPAVEDTEAYRQDRKRALYRAAAEAAAADGVITTEERAMLDTLRREIELDAESAVALERAALEARVS